MTTLLQQRVIDAFGQHFGGAPTLVVRAPGRVNLIGEHTDYNDGFVLPMAINRATYIALRPRDDGQVIVHSLDFDQTAAFAPSNMANDRTGWSEYIKGVAWVLRAGGYKLTGWDGVVAGDVPIGAGLSSSASIELATARAFSAVSNIEWKPASMAQLAQRAENEWVGVSCGIMDQMISAAGVRDHALLIDCRTLETTPVPLPADTAVVILDTSTRRGLVDSLYNERRKQCEAAARFFGVDALRDVSIEQFNARAEELDEVTSRRARHIITENARTLDAAEAMKRGDAATLGQLMNASHASLRDDFEVTNPALNEIVDAAQGEEVCFGARMTGAGFGGCAVALVRADGAEHFAVSVGRQYLRATGFIAAIYISTASEGASIVED